ncbi:MAG: hypothetical protein FWC58_05480 [Desulfobulbus sp.]|nr:hypothetical protein [Desulfobulbus sp.]
MSYTLHTMNPNHQAQSTSSKLVGIATSTEAASIGLLVAIDDTVDALQGIASVMRGFSSMIAGYGESIRTLTVAAGEYIDADGVAVDAMASAADALKRMLTRLVVLRSSIDRDTRLKQHHGEALHDAYDAAISEVAELVETLLDTRAAVITHDLAAEPRDGRVFRSAEDLIADLRNPQ